MRFLVFLLLFISPHVYAQSVDSTHSVFSLAFGKVKSFYFQNPKDLQSLRLDKSSMNAPLGVYVALNYRKELFGLGIEYCAQNRNYTYLNPSAVNWYDVVSEKHSISINTWKLQTTYKFVNKTNFKAYACAGLMLNSMYNNTSYKFVKDTSINYYWHRDYDNKVYRSSYWSVGVIAEYNCYEHIFYAQAQANLIRQSPLANGSNELARTTFQLGINIMFSQFLKALERGVFI